MHIVVCVKQVPDAGNLRIDPGIPAFVRTMKRDRGR